MKVNSINTISYNNFNKTNKPSFKHTAVPYPEYENAYKAKTNSDALKELMNKLTLLFEPQVQTEADKIKARIENIANPTKVSPKEHLLSVLA